jgi:hypothetical protein
VTVDVFLVNGSLALTAGRRSEDRKVGGLLRRVFLLDVHVGIVLDHSVVGDHGVGALGCRTEEKHRTVDELVPSQCVVPLDDDGVDVGDEEEGGQESDTTARAENDANNELRGLFVQAEVRGPLVDDRERADGTGNLEGQRNEEKVNIPRRRRARSTAPMGRGSTGGERRP